MPQPPHPALFVPDIVDEILLWLRPTEAEDTTSGWTALARASRVCKAFREPATRSLWWAIPGLEPVLQLLAARSLLSMTTTDVSRNQYLVQTTDSSSRDKTGRSYTMPQGAIRDVPREDWERLRQCTAYTRAIHKGRQDCHVSPDVYVFLSYRCNARPLFPQVRLVTWNTEAPDHLGLLPLLSPTVRTLKLDLGLNTDRRTLNWWSVPRHQDPIEGPSVDQILQTALPRLGGLSELEVRATTDIPYAREEASWVCFSGLQHLRILTINRSCLVSSLAFLQNLASLPVLAELSIFLTGEALVAPSALSGFSALEKLSLDVFSVPNEGVLNPFVSPGLHTLSMRFDRVRRTTIPATLNHVARAYPQIRSISIKERTEQSWEDGVTLPAFSTVFGELSRCAGMEEFVLQTHRAFIVSNGSDADLARLAQRWPKLRVFSFLAATSGERLTHRTVLAFAQHCLELRTLHLRGVDFGGLTKEEVRALRPSTHALEELGVCAMRAGHARRCCRFLYKLFPVLRVPTAAAWLCPSCSESPRHTLRFSRYTECTRALDTVFQPHNAPRQGRGRG